MKGVHARRPLVPFWVLTAALVTVAGSVAVGASALIRDRGSSGAGDDASALASAGGDRGASTPHAPLSPDPKGRIVIHGAGDVSLDPGYNTTYATQGYDYAWWPYRR